MSTLTVRVLAAGFERVLVDDVQVVPAGGVVISVAGARSKNIRLDGRALRLSSGEPGLLSVDMVRSTGFHRLVVDDQVFWFGTEDAKLGLAGITQMLQDLATMGTGWTGQALFSDGNGFRDPHVSYGWLDQWADQALSAVGAVIASPRSSTTTTRVLRRRGGAGVLLAPTLRLLRSDPRRYLAEAPNGVIEAAGRRYEPLRVVARRRESTLDTIANRRAVAILPWIDRLAHDVVAAKAGPEAVARCRLWSNRARSLQRRPLAQAIGAHTIGAHPRQAEEIMEVPYRTTYRIARDLSDNFGWSAAIEPTARLSYVQYSDAIYQAYAASRVAKELGLTQTAPVLGAAQPAFSGERFDLYYDTTPPAEVLRSWRFHSARPDDSAPDLLLHERTTGLVAVLDAKYRVARDGGASEDSRKDVSAYMSLYGVQAVTILYPGTAEAVRTLSGQGQRIIEASVAPAVEDVSAAVLEVLSSLQRPPY